ncbi:MAG: hypothetical protein JWM10_2712 [Myxococcaceae bacterium]|nr:hypothetical protein [Myxococcaceae bacterium]
MGEASMHEFGAADDVVFLDLAGSASRVGVAGYGLGGVLLLAGVLGLAHPPFHLPHHAAPVVAIITLVGAVPPFLAARHLRASAVRLRAVALTAGDDVAHLMAAVDGLQRAFTALVAMLALDALGLAAVVALLFPRGA